MAAIPDSDTWVPDIKYAHNGDVSIAYQDWGEGDVTMIGLPGIVSNIEVIWEDREARAWLTGLGSFARIVVYDKRGQGLSDPSAGVPTLEERLGDLTAVIDAVGADRVALAGISEGGATAAMYAATFPDRVSHLITFGSFALPPSGEFVESGMKLWAEHWGTPQTLSIPLLAPDKQGDADFLRFFNRFERQSTSPGGLLASWAWIREIDIRPVLGSIQCPTLIQHRVDENMVPIEQARELAELIPGAKLSELPGTSHSPAWGDIERPLAEMEELITGHAPTPKAAERVLATVMFTDIVDSTARASTLGDSAWRKVLDSHDTISRAKVAEHGGRFIKGTGDGILATFDAPSRGLMCADALRGELAAAGVDIRAGVHTGEVELRGDDVAGIGVHIAARVAGIAGSGELLASRTVRDLSAGSGYTFTSRGTHALKGVPDEWELLEVS